MKPTKPGFYWYKKQPVKVDAFSKKLKWLVVYTIGSEDWVPIENTDDAGWGEEIKAA